MTIIVDTGVLYADHDTDANRHEAARNALEAVYKRYKATAQGLTPGLKPTTHNL